MPGLYPVPEPLLTAYTTSNMEAGQPRRLVPYRIVSEQSAPRSSSYGGATVSTAET